MQGVDLNLRKSHLLVEELLLCLLGLESVIRVARFDSSSSLSSMILCFNSMSSQISETNNFISERKEEQTEKEPKPLLMFFAKTLPLFVHGFTIYYDNRGGSQ